MICIENKDFVLDEHTVVTLGKFDGIRTQKTYSESTGIIT